MQYRGLQKESKMQIKAVYMVTVDALPSNDMRLHGTFCKSSVLSVLLLARIIVLEAPSLPGKREIENIYKKCCYSEIPINKWFIQINIHLGLSSLHSSICSFSLFWEMARHRRLDPCRKVESAWLEFHL